MEIVPDFLYNEGVSTFSHTGYGGTDENYK